MSIAAETAPARVAIHVGFACNNRCISCAQGDLRVGEAQPSSPTVEAELRQAATRGADVALVGGEPTLRADLPDLAAAARSFGVGSVLLQTNGRRLAYRRYAEAIAAAGVDALEVSWQGARPEVHDNHTAVVGSWQQTTAGLRVAVALGLPVSVSAVLTRSSLRHAAELVDGAASLGVSAVHLAFPVVLGTAESFLPRVVPRLAQLPPHLEAAAAAAGRCRVPLFVSGVPACVWDAAGAGVTALERLVRREGGAPGLEVCQACAARGTCGGVDPAYLGRYGASELDPRRAVGDRDVTPLATRGRGFAGLGRVGLEG